MLGRLLLAREGRTGPPGGTGIVWRGIGGEASPGGESTSGWGEPEDNLNDCHPDGSNLSVKAATRATGGSVSLFFLIVSPVALFFLFWQLRAFPSREFNSQQLWLTRIWNARGKGSVLAL